ncbi:MAG TPA: transposase [Cyanobacteria bacterium UBA11049]|nr:transposase [Cyanobacteria bacterium UBA11049]
MNKKHNREKQAAILYQAQQQRKQQKKEQVLKAVQQLQQDKQPLTFPNIAKVAGCSVSYLYKWSEITAYIHDLQSQETHQLHHLEEKSPTPHSLKTLHEVSKQRIRELEVENRDLKRQNEKLRGHVAEIYELREECNRLRQQLQELTTPKSANKVVSLSSVKPEPQIKAQAADIPQDILESIKGLGVKPGVRLLREIRNHNPQKVRSAIAAFEQYRSKTAVDSPGGCLLKMIQDEAEPNVPQQPTAPEESEFDRWYVEAIRTGFCLDIPKNHLSIFSGELQVKVKSLDSPGGYRPIPWREAKALMEEINNI